MTDEELCGWLRSMLPASGFAPTENWAPWLGAARIETQAAEIEKLEALFTNATYEARAMMEEIERLRAELSGWREMAGKAEQ